MIIAVIIDNRKKKALEDRRDRAKLSNYFAAVRFRVEQITDFMDDLKHPLLDIIESENLAPSDFYSLQNFTKIPYLSDSLPLHAQDVYLPENFIGISLELDENLEYISAELSELLAKKPFQLRVVQSELPFDGPRQQADMADLRRHAEDLTGSIDSAVALASQLMDILNREQPKTIKEG